MLYENMRRSNKQNINVVGESFEALPNFFEIMQNNQNLDYELGYEN